MAEHADWPEWWRWELAFTSHVRRRMTERGFSETNLREMLTDAEGFVPDIEPGRQAILTRWHGGAWKVIVEPNAVTEHLVVITAYRLE